MLSLSFTLFLAGILTIFLPCILPLVPIVLGVSIAGRSRWRPLATVGGMVVSFVSFTFLLQVALMQFVTLAALVQTATYASLVLFAAGFLTERRWLQWLFAALGASFFLSDGWAFAAGAFVMGVTLLEIGGWLAPRLQQIGADAQDATRRVQGDNLVTSFVVGLTLGLVWVPCAGPALGLALALVREQPDLTAFAALTAYALGAAVPLLLVGYGGQLAVGTVYRFTKYTGTLKRVAGVLLLLTAIALRWNLFSEPQLWLAGTRPAEIAQRLEDSLFPGQAPTIPNADGVLPDLGPAPAFIKLGPWHNSQPLKPSDLAGKVVLVDFWTYSCINCLRTLPTLEAYWERFKAGPFVIVGVHTPEFAFEQDASNVADAVERLGIEYPVAQDNTYGTWRAFSNHYWPAKYLIDATGRIRYQHFGEGNEQETADAIQSLLLEAGYSFESAPGKPEVAPERRPTTPETYLGIRGWSSLANGGLLPTDEPTDYVAPDDLPLNMVALDGRWELKQDERQVLDSGTGSLRIRALAAEVNLVLGPEREGDEIPAEVRVDGGEPKPLLVDRSDMFRLFQGDYGEHDVLITFFKPGVAAYAYTFGS